MKFWKVYRGVFYHVLLKDIHPLLNKLQPNWKFSNLRLRHLVLCMPVLSFAGWTWM